MIARAAGAWVGLGIPTEAGAVLVAGGTADARAGDAERRRDRARRAARAAVGGVGLEIAAGAAVGAIGADAPAGTAAVGEPILAADTHAGVAARERGGAGVEAGAAVGGIGGDVVAAAAAVRELRGASGA